MSELVNVGQNSQQTRPKSHERIWERMQIANAHVEARTWET